MIAISVSTEEISETVPYQFAKIMGVTDIFIIHLHDQIEIKRQAYFNQLGTRDPLLPNLWFKSGYKALTPEIDGKNYMFQFNYINAKCLFFLI